MIVGGKQVNWSRQKWQELLRSLFQEKKHSLMVRMDIPLSEHVTKERALELAEKLMQDMTPALSEAEKVFILGN